MKKLLLIPLGLGLLAACMPMPMSGPVSHGTSPEVCANVIARETVHKHLKNIYGKLGVHSRAEATARARSLGLL